MMAFSGVRNSWDVRQELGLVPRGFLERLVQPPVVNRQGGLGGEGLEQGDHLGGELAWDVTHHHQTAQDVVLP